VAKTVQIGSQEVVVQDLTEPTKVLTIWCIQIDIYEYLS
jgi:hypothetical protein